MPRNINKIVRSWIRLPVMKYIPVTSLPLIEILYIAQKICILNITNLCLIEKARKSLLQYLYTAMPERSAISSGYRSTFTDQLQQHTHQVQPFYGNLNLNNSFMCWCSFKEKVKSLRFFTVFSEIYNKPRTSTVLFIPALYVQMYQRFRRAAAVIYK